MTDTERLLLQAAATQINLLRKITHGLNIYRDAHAENVEERIEAVLDSQTADEVDALK